MDNKVIVISSCKECPFLGYTESDWYCKKMPVGDLVWRKINNVSGIHDLCPLPDLKSLIARP